MKSIPNNYKIVDDYVIIYLTTNKKEILECYLDLEDFYKIKNKHWHPFYAEHVKSYYARTLEYIGIYDNGNYKYKLYYMHRVIMDAPDEFMVDHKNHNTLDNRKYNLELKDNSGNLRNRLGLNNNNKSGYRNVCWNKRKNKWMVQLQVKGKNTQLGFFHDVDEAGKFAKEMRLKYYGELTGDHL